MPRPQKPTELLELTGAFKHDPDRRRPIGPKSERDLGEPPESLTPAEAACWREMVGNSPGGVLTSADRMIIEMLARLLAKSRVEWLKGQEWALMLQCCVRLGWTPADRSKITSVDDKKAESELDEFLN